MATNALSLPEQSQLRKSLSSPAILTNGVSGFIATLNASTGGIDVSFLVASITGISAITLLRNYVSDIGTATVINTWSAPQATNYIWSDTDSTLQTYGQALYWLTLSPVGASGTAVNVGPQTVSLNPDLSAPNAPLAISASHAAAVSGTILITLNVSGVPSSGTIKIYVTGYQGNASPVAIAQSASSPLQVTLQDTGETVTFTAETVSIAGIESTGGPTTTLTLDSGETVPAQIQGVNVNAIPSGNEVTWPSSEDSVTSYDIYRGPIDQPFSGSVLLATISPGSGSTQQYLDTAGLGGNYAYFIIAHNGTGASTPSDGQTGLGALATLNQTDTPQITSGAVNASISFYDRLVIIPVVIEEQTVIATVTASGSPLLVSVRVQLQVLAGPDGGDMVFGLYQGDTFGTLIGVINATPMPAGVWTVPFFMEGIDTAPGTDQVYTVACTSIACQLYVGLVADMRKV